MLEGYRINPVYNVLEQIDKSNRVTYDSKYVEDRYEHYKDLCDKMGYLRLGFIIGSGISGESILDVGYGNGAFLNCARHMFPLTVGFDINGFDISHIENVKTTDKIEGHYDVVTFYDSLEHFDDIGFVKDLDCNFVVITIPHLAIEESDEYFKNWKHRRENEHFWHFDSYTLTKFMDDMGYSEISSGFPEDAIRHGTDKYINTWTAAFRKRK